jgi:hypothetical protein
LIDNLSTDKTVEKIKNIYPDLIHVEIDDYLPGLALNKGIRAYPPASTLSVYPPTVSRSTMSG